jgi:hypothetical protein
LPARRAIGRERLSCDLNCIDEDDAVTTEDDLLEVARREFGESSGWVPTVGRETSGFVVTAEHPASPGLVIETGTLDGDLAVQRIVAGIDRREVALADAAPEFAHPDTVAGVRNLARAFDWPTVQVRAVAFLLFEAGALTADEAAWLTGFVANDAPMVHTPPI